MALRQKLHPKQNLDRHETDYERWLKDHDGHYQPAGKPQYHPSDVDITIEDGDESEYNLPLLQEYIKTETKTELPSRLAEKNIDVGIDDERSAVQSSRYGSIMLPSTHHSGDSGHRISADNSLLRIGQRDSTMCCMLSFIFSIVVLLGMGLGVKKRRQRQRQRRAQFVNGMSRDKIEFEKVC